MGQEIPLCHQQLGKQLGGRQPLLPVSRRHPQDHVHDEHHRRPEPPVPESDEDQGRVPQRHIPGEDVVPCKPERSEEVDAEVPELGPGSEPADGAVRGTAHETPVKRTGMAVSENPCHPSHIPSAFILLPESPSLIPEAGCGQRPQKAIRQNACLPCKKSRKNV